MATPRKRYFYVATQVLRLPWPREKKLTMVLLCAYLADRWARDGVLNTEAGRAHLSDGALRDITGKKRRRSGIAALRELGQLVSLSVEERDHSVLIEWPKFAIFQQLVSDGGASAGSARAPSADADADADARESAEGADAASSKDEKVEKQKKTSPPEWAFAAAEQLRDHLTSVKGAQLPRSLEGWAKEIGRIQRTSPEEIKQVLDWLFSGENEGEFRIIVQSGRALREKFGRIVAAMERSRRPAGADTQRIMNAETARRGRAADRERDLRKLFNQGLIQSPDETAHADWQAQGAPREPCWWAEGEIYRPTEQENADAPDHQCL